MYAELMVRSRDARECLCDFINSERGSDLTKEAISGISLLPATSFGDSVAGSQRVAKLHLTKECDTVGRGQQRAEEGIGIEFQWRDWRRSQRASLKSVLNALKHPPRWSATGDIQISVVGQDKGCLLARSPS